jgi:hypothetical protein
VGDINGDHNPDLVVSNYDGKIGILLGNGDGTFKPAISVNSSLPGVDSVVLADLNGDNKLDLVASSGADCFPACLQLVSVMFGKGNGTFDAPQLYTTGGIEVSQVVVADVNGDNKPDLLVSNQCADQSCLGQGVLGVLLSNGDGTFASAQTYPTGDKNAMSLALGDVNDDKKLDVVVIHEDGTVSVLFGNEDGSFDTATNYPTHPGANAVAVADVNGDGNADLVVTTYCLTNICGRAQVAVLLNNGNGTFQDAQFYTTGAAFAELGVAVVDVNGDGNLDVLVPHLCAGHGFCDSSAIDVMPGDGTGAFNSIVRFQSAGRNATNIVVADLNGDSKPDMIVTNECVSYSDCTTGTVAVLLGNSGVQTSTVLQSSLNPSTYGQSVTLTAHVTSVGASAPTGKVRFSNGSTSLGTATISAGVATLTKSNLPAGTLSLTATYLGDTNSAKSTSAAISQVVHKASTTTMISSSANPSVVGQAVTFTAKVASPTTKAVGTVTFSSGATVLATVTISGGKASFSTSSLPKGSNPITATYEGTSNIAGSTASLTQMVN